MEKRISLTKENIEYLRRAFSHFFPEDTIYSADKPFESGEFNWKNRAHFINFVFRLTGVPIKSERDLASIKKAQLEIEKLLSDAASIEKPIDSNLPDKEARELQELERQRREAEIQETEAQSKESVEEAIRRKQSIYEEIARQTTPKEQPSNDGPVIVQASAKEEPVTKESPDQSVWKNLIKEVQPKVPQQTTYVKPSYQGEVLKDKKVSVVTKEILPEVTLTPEEKERIFDLAQAIKTDPGTVQKIIE